MAVSHSLAARNAIASAVCALVDQGSTYTSGRLVIYNGSSTVISTLPLSKPAFGSASGGQCSANPISMDMSPPGAGQLPSFYVVQDCNGNEVFTGLCGVSGDLFQNGGALAAPVSCNGLAYEAPP